MGGTQPAGTRLNGASYCRSRFRACSRLEKADLIKLVTAAPKTTCANRWRDARIALLDVEFGLTRRRQVFGLLVSFTIAAVLYSAAAYALEPSIQFHARSNSPMHLGLRSRYQQLYDFAPEDYWARAGRFLLVADFQHLGCCCRSALRGRRMGDSWAQWANKNPVRRSS